MHNVHIVSSVLFQDLTEDCSPGDSLSDYSEKLLQRGKGGARIYMNFFCWEKHVVKQKKIIANHKEQTSRVNAFSAFACKMQEYGVTEIFP